MLIRAVEDQKKVEAKLVRVNSERVEEFAAASLIAAGTNSDGARSVASALTETSLRGVDSHGIRLLMHYIKMLRGGRINPKARLRFEMTGPGTGIVDADDGFGHYASFFAIERAGQLVRESGIAAVSIINSSHFGAAGCYVLKAAERGDIALGVCNSDSFVLAHDGVKPFHGTNPIAFAAPIAGSRPLLMDMATSCVPWNRVQDLMNEKRSLPPDVAVDKEGAPTLDPTQSAALLPLGGFRYGYKGAALASMVEILSAILTGMPHCSRLLRMIGSDICTPRKLGHFFIVIDPTRFVSSEVYRASMGSYLSDLRSQVGRNGRKVMAPGDREWTIERERKRLGIPVGNQLKIDLDQLADSLAINRLSYF